MEFDSPSRPARKPSLIERFFVYITDVFGAAGMLLAPVALRFYLAPVFFTAGYRKFDNFASTATWFEKSLELPYPELMAVLATGAELVGAVLIALGLATRWICIPLLITMIVAAWTVHFEHGWLAIAPSGEVPYKDALALIRETLQNSGVWEQATEHGRIVILQNGWQMAGTYIVCLLALMATGGGKYTSLDYFIRKR